MEITIVGRATEILVALDALELLLIVQEASVPEPTGDGRVRVHAVVVDPEAPENQPTDAEVCAELGIPLSVSE